MAKFFNGIISEPMISYNMEDGSIEFILPAGDVMEMGNDPFVLAVVSE